MPWGVRVLDKPSSLGIDVGTPVPQVALAETIRTRAARNSKEFAIPPTFSLAHPPRPNGAAGRGREANDTTSSEMIEEAGRLLPDWGPYPELVNIQSDQGEWVFKFRNHESDATPSTVARGDHRTLWIVGGGHSLEGKFFLPDGLTAQEFGEHLASRFNVKNGPVTDGETNKSQTSRQGEEGPTLDWAALKKISATEFMRSSIERTFPEALSRVPFSILRDAYRTKVRRAIPSPPLMTIHLSFKRSCPAPGRVRDKGMAPRPNETIRSTGKRQLASPWPWSPLPPFTCHLVSSHGLVGFFEASAKASRGRVALVSERVTIAVVERPTTASINKGNHRQEHSHGNPLHPREPHRHP